MLDITYADGDDGAVNSLRERSLFAGTNEALDSYWEEQNVSALCIDFSETALQLAVWRTQE